MKKRAAVVISLLTMVFSCISPDKLGNKAPVGPINEVLVGTWEFQVLNDENGRRVDTIWYGMGYEIPKGPLLTLNADGTYAKQFTPGNIDRGNWYFEASTQKLVLLLYYQKPYDDVAKYLIEDGHAKKDEKGDYYEVISHELTSFSSTEMTWKESKGYRKFLKRKS